MVEGKQLQRRLFTQYQIAMSIVHTTMLCVQYV